MTGRRGALFELLARGSHLPGKRINAGLAEAFARACRAAGSGADPVVFALARLTPKEAPGATALEFLPVCGIYAMGFRAAADEAVRKAMVAELHAHADDVRFRVRDAVVGALGRIGHAAGDPLVLEVAPWMDGYFHAAAVVDALASEAWLGSVRDPTQAAARLEEAFALAENAPRSAARSPGHKELLDVLERAVVPIGSRFGVVVFDVLERRCQVSDPVQRALIERTLQSRSLAGRYPAEVARVRRALEATQKAPRNPDHDVGPTRNRSRDRGPRVPRRGSGR